jgi:hypothetical protein
MAPVYLGKLHVFVIRQRLDAADAIAPTSLSRDSASLSIARPNQIASGEALPQFTTFCDKLICYGATHLRKTARPMRPKRGGYTGVSSRFVMSAQSCRRV